MKAWLGFLFAVILQGTPSIAFGNPDILPQYSFNRGADYVHLTGSWIGDTPDSGDPYFRDFAIQTSEITCYKARRVCFEARAVSKGRVMYSKLIEYQVIEWNGDKILAVLDGTAATIELAVNFKNEIVFLTTKQRHSAGKNQLPDRAHLDDGMKAIQRTSEK